MASSAPPRRFSLKLEHRVGQDRFAANPVASENSADLAVSNLGDPRNPGTTDQPYLSSGGGPSVVGGPPLTIPQSLGSRWKMARSGAYAFGAHRAGFFFASDRTGQFVPLSSALEDCRAHHKPKIRKTTKATIKMKKSTLAIPAAAAEIPVKPNKPAMIETIKKNSASLSTASLGCLFSFRPEAGPT